jgi:hypothetical protein
MAALLTYCKGPGKGNSVELLAELKLSYDEEGVLATAADADEVRGPESVLLT